ncbi:phosphate acetyltransferase [Phnomibacter ginsenosidimutans]|uniref:Phosphate acetyltransferase n=1 Tax=Phnomibacter ginsenosidimutans TaxID=2676868 RepID=A0A6I6G5R6_9BACT|nr:phosphate acetyltransferase [Phnomibacter ginsenosidimutans]QGW27324.1 phosphate acetyltransferase [Phnomibacter ginsenosidimutans]
MAKTIFIATTEPYSGKSLVALGVLHMLLGKARKVAYFKPIINEESADKKDADIETVIQHFGVSTPYEDMYAFTRSQALQQMQNEGRGEIIDLIINKVKALEESNDFTVIEGSDFLGEGTAFEFEANVAIANNLSAPVIIVVSGQGKSTAQIVQNVQTVLSTFLSHDVQVLAVVVNKVAKDMVDDVQALLSGQLGNETLLCVIPKSKGLQSPTVKEIQEQIGGKVLAGESLLTNQVDNFITGAMHLPNFLSHISENVLIVTPGDRGDIIIGAMQANLSANYPKVAGIVLTGGIEPEPQIMRLVEGSQSAVPLISVKSGTFRTTTNLGSIQSRLSADNPKKIQLAINSFEKYMDVQLLEQKMVTYVPEGITPHMFQYQLTRKAKAQLKHIVLPEGNDDRILKAAARLINNDIVRLTILGNPAEVTASFKRLGLFPDMSKITVLDPATAECYEDFWTTLYELRKAKNVTEEMARDLMTDVSYFGTMMVYKGMADGMVSGAVHTTQHTIRPALQFVKTKPGISTVSSVFFMCLPDRVSVFGDCAVNPDPTAEQLAEIAISSAESSQAFGIEPRIAMLSYSSGSSGEGADVDKVRQATAIVKAKRPDLKVEGPIQYDAAVDPSVGRQKMPGSEVAGQASVLIFPDLNTGNNTYKAVQRETGALAIGPMLQGLNKPINDLSRGCTVEDVYNTVIITAIQAQEQ